MSSLSREDSRPQPNKGHKILQENKDDLLSRVAAIKLVDFSVKLRESLVISQKVHDVFAMLDDTLKPQLRVRYLVQCVCEGVKQDVTVFNRFLKVLAVYGGSAKQLAKYLCEEYGCDSGAGPENLAAADGTDSSRTLGGDIYLVQDNLPDLMEILVEVCDKWQLLGIALRIPQHTLDDCKGSTNALCMTKILSEWISRNQPARITLKKLQLALASQLVGRGGIANILEERFIESQKPSEIIPVAMTAESEASLSVVCQSCSTKVADGRSTLLEVQVNVNEGATYLWMKDGLAITDGQAYCGSHLAILLISPASQATQGKYTCQITKGSEKVIISDEVLLTVSFPPVKEHLIKQYSKTREVSRDSWPPEVTNTYINLALVTKKKTITESFNYSIRGDIDDILEKKEKVDFEAVFGVFEAGALVLVEGRPGSGKTTLVHKVKRDWATGGEVLRNARLVFLISLRQLANSKTEELSDILQLLYQDREECEKVARDIKQSMGVGVCFIFDGLDEFHPQAETKSVIHQLLYKKYLPAAMVIVASRPVATDKLRCEPHVTRRIEVLGFSHPQILEYIDNYPFTSDATNSASTPSQLKAYLTAHHNLLHMCYLPVHVAMICFLYEHKRGDIPQTETEIYMHFTKFMVLRDLKRSNDQAELSSLEELCGEVGEYFNKICQLAFDMTTHSTQTVCQRDTKLPHSLATGSDDSSTLGLVTVDRTAGLHQLDSTYAFLHLTLQEYLAARYLAKLKKKEQKKMIKMYAGENHMQVVWKFYCGMVKSKDRVAEIQHIMWPADKKKRSRDASLYEVHCAFVSQELVLCDNLVKESKGVLSYKNCSLTPADMTAVGYVISSTCHPITELDMSGCNLGDDHVRTLLGEVSHNQLKSILTLSFHGNNISDAGASSLASGLKSCNNLQWLHLSNNKISGAGATSLASGLKSCNNLQGLWLSNNNISDAGATCMASGLKSCNNLQKLSLSNTNISDAGASSLASGLKSSNNLQLLDLSNNNIDDAGASSLASGLKSCTNLQSLYLSNNNICDAGASSLASGLKPCKNLQWLNLSNNNITAAGRAALRAQLKCSHLWV